LEELHGGSLERSEDLEMSRGREADQFMKNSSFTAACDQIRQHYDALRKQIEPDDTKALTLAALREHVLDDLLTHLQAIAQTGRLAAEARNTRGYGQENLERARVINGG